MTGDSTLSYRSIKLKPRAFPPDMNLAQAQRVVYDFLLDIVKVWPPEDVLEEFRHLFVHHSESVSSQTIPALHLILFANDEVEFRNTLKRCCYILVNNWELARQFEPIQALVGLFDDPLLRRRTLSPTLKRLRKWLCNFVESQDFQDLKLFAARFSEERTLNRPGEWASRYTSYLLVPQYVDETNPIEQREAAKTLSRRLRDKFKFDLAMYTAHAQSPSAVPAHKPVQNPTALGDGVLRLIKAIVAKRGDFSYRNLSRLFLEQIHGGTYLNFKASLTKYLLFTVRSNPISQQIESYLETRLTSLYTEHNSDPLNPSLLLRTCNRMIDCLMTENQEMPSPLFTLVLSQGNCLTLAIILLKLILISRNSHLYLEVRIADLIRYYEAFPREQCQWVINFLEVFQVTFAICADNIEYNLVKVEKASSIAGQTDLSGDDLATFRIFSQMIHPSRYPSDNDPSLPLDV
ncbi:MAG: hypothetical protein ACKO63_15310 [Nodosilinea sp.]